MDAAEELESDSFLLSPCDVAAFPIHCGQMQNEKKERGIIVLILHQLRILLRTFQIGKSTAAH